MVADKVKTMMLPMGGSSSKRWAHEKRSRKGLQLVLFLVADRAYEGDETRQWPSLWATRRSSHPEATAATRGTTTVRYRNEVERLFRRLKGYRRVFTRYVDVMFLAFITLALIHDTLRNVNTP